MKNENNMCFYEKLSKCPNEALKTIQAGDLKGFSDINPMWRIKIMTETFGPCGIGWKYKIVKQWNESYGNEIKTYCNINLFIKVDGEWSEPIPGTGGSTFVAQYSKGTKVSDENYKMALTDALSVCMKMLGVAANVYWDKGQFETKYQQPQQPQKPVSQASAKDEDEQSEEELLVLAKGEFAQAETIEDLRRTVSNYPTLRNNDEFLKAGTKAKKRLGIA